MYCIRRCFALTLPLTELYHKFEGGDNVEKDFIRAADLAQILGCSKSTSYRLMRQIRKELDAQGLLTLPGIVPRSYTLKRLGVNANVI
jgi:hypothetical protein